MSTKQQRTTAVARRLVAMLHGGVMVVTTALVTAFDPKLPPFKGD
ncbi:MAG TPA: hypothetical protein VJT31_17740 [Rugosimonospora sp.]|nr:hypothetical protein [Rugosimonospora sp.]